MPSTLVPPPGPDEYAPYYARYISRVPQGDVLGFLQQQRDRVRELLAGVGEPLAGHRYAVDKWSIKGVVGHLSDAERIFAYRALRVARGDETPLPGWDQDPYAALANFDARSMASLAREWLSVRDATLTLFDGFDAACWTRRGTASNAPVSVRSLAYMIAGHTTHHAAILRERYGVGGSA